MKYFFFELVRELEMELDSEFEIYHGRVILSLKDDEYFFLNGQSDSLTQTDGQRLGLLEQLLVLS